MTAAARVSAIRIGDPEIEVRVKPNARARRMVLRVAKSDVEPTLTVPPGVPLQDARAFLTVHEGWLRLHLATRPKPRVVVDGARVTFGDEMLTVRLHEGRRMERTGDTLLVPATRLGVGVRVAAWMKEEARRLCLQGVERCAARLGCAFGRVRLGDPRARWGSCTSRGDLMFSWRLIMAPTAVLDYVIAHEVAHLVEFNHSRRFWALVEQLCPNHATARDWLRRHGAELHAYDFRPV